MVNTANHPELVLICKECAENEASGERTCVICNKELPAEGKSATCGNSHSKCARTLRKRNAKSADRHLRAVES